MWLQIRPGRRRVEAEQTREVDVTDLSDTLSNRVEALIRPRRRPEEILSTTGTRAALQSLIARTEALEEAVRELTEAVRVIADSQRHSAG